MNVGMDPMGSRPRTAVRERAPLGSATGVLRAQRVRAGASARTGIVGWWLNLTAPPVPGRILPLRERERLRKAELTSFSILAVFLFLLALVSNSLAHPSTAQAVVVMAVGLVVAAFLNRAGWTRTAAYLIPTLLMALIALAVVGTKGGLELAMLPAYDLFVLPIFLTSLIGDRRAPWLFAMAAIAFIVADFALQPHALIMAQGANNFDSIQYLVTAVTWWGGVNRHVALALFAAFFGWLGARSVDAAMQRADQAEELAALEHAVAEQRRQLEVGAQQILETHVRIANGDFAARAPVMHDNLLWQVAASLNNLLARLQKAGQAEHQLRRTDEEMQRLAVAIDSARMGRHPIWPAPSGTSADLIIERVSSRPRPMPQHMAQPTMPARMTPQPMGQPAPQPWPATMTGMHAPPRPFPAANALMSPPPPMAPSMGSGSVGNGPLMGGSPVPPPPWAMSEPAMPWATANAPRFSPPGPPPVIQHTPVVSRTAPVAPLSFTEEDLWPSFEVRSAAPVAPAMPPWATSDPLPAMPETEDADEASPETVETHG